MNRRRLPRGAVCLLVVTLAGCGESQDPPTRPPGTLGGVKEGAPLVAAPPDAGILADPTQYTPRKLPSADEGARPAGGGAPSDAEAGLRVFVERVEKSLKSSDTQALLDAFDPEQIAALGDARNALFATAEKLDLLRKVTEEKLGTREVAVLEGANQVLKYELLDPQHASVSPNWLGPLLFGPQRATPALPAVLQGGQWRFQLDPPLSAADAPLVALWHQAMQRALDQAVDWVQATETFTPEELGVKVGTLIAGEMMRGGATTQPAEAAPPAEQTKGAEEKNPPAPGAPPRGRGGGRGPGS